LDHRILNILEGHVIGRGHAVSLFRSIIRF
jgi:hypothetical protein